MLDFLIIIHYSTHSILWGKLYIVCICIVYCYIALLGSCKNRIEFSDPRRKKKILIYQATVISLGLFEDKNSLIVLNKHLFSPGIAVLGGIQNARFWVAVVTLWSSPDPYPFLILRSMHLPCFVCPSLYAKEETETFLSTELGLRNP